MHHQHRRKALKNKKQFIAFINKLTCRSPKLTASRSSISNSAARRAPKEISLASSSSSIPD